MDSARFSEALVRFEKLIEAVVSDMSCLFFFHHQGPGRPAVTLRIGQRTPLTGDFQVYQGYGRVVPELGGFPEFFINGYSKADAGVGIRGQGQRAGQGDDEILLFFTQKPPSLSRDFRRIGPALILSGM